MDGIKTDLFPSNLRAGKKKAKRQEKVEQQKDRAESMAAENEYTDTMTPGEPLPEAELTGKGEMA